MLPKSAQNLVRLIGFELTMEMVRQMGGVEFCFPVQPEGREYDWLAEVVGKRAAKVLQTEYKGEPFYVPLCTRALKAGRNRLLIAAYEEKIRAGRSGRAAVREILLDSRFRGISYRTVENIVNKPTPPSMPEMAVQGTLF